MPRRPPELEGGCRCAISRSSSSSSPSSCRSCARATCRASSSASAAPTSRSARSTWRSLATAVLAACAAARRGRSPRAGCVARLAAPSRSLIVVSALPNGADALASRGQAGRALRADARRGRVPRHARAARDAPRRSSSRSASSRSSWGAVEFVDWRRRASGIVHRRARPGRPRDAGARRSAWRSCSRTPAGYRRRSRSSASCAARSAIVARRVAREPARPLPRGRACSSLALVRARPAPAARRS